jgi:release factor glutamine methyltransferase
LQAAGIENPRLEARLLLAHALGTTVADLLRHRDAAIDAADLVPLLARRVAREPLALILGTREFWSLNFAVSRDTLIPRPESETVIEAAIEAYRDRPPSLLLDLGTGTGCLLLAALSEFPSAFGVGVDRSAAAASLAQHNAIALGLAARACFICGNWADALVARFDLVLCNPPYIPTSEINGLMPEVARYEPYAALDGGSDGLAAYRHLLSAVPHLLAPDGVAVLELGAGQANSVSALALKAGLVVEFRNDLAGIVRAIVARQGLP